MVSILDIGWNNLITINRTREGVGLLDEEVEQARSCSCFIEIQTEENFEHQLKKISASSTLYVSHKMEMTILLSLVEKQLIKKFGAVYVPDNLKTEVKQSINEAASAKNVQLNFLKTNLGERQIYRHYILWKQLESVKDSRISILKQVSNIWDKKAQVFEAEQAQQLERRDKYQEELEFYKADLRLLCRIYSAKVRKIKDVLNPLSNKDVLVSSYLQLPMLHESRQFFDFANDVYVSFKCTEDTKKLLEEMCRSYGLKSRSLGAARPLIELWWGLKKLEIERIKLQVAVDNQVVADVKDCEKRIEDISRSNLEIMEDYVARKVVYICSPKEMEALISIKNTLSFDGRVLIYPSLPDFVVAEAITGGIQARTLTEEELNGDSGRREMFKLFRTFRHLKSEWVGIEVRIGSLKAGGLRVENDILAERQRLKKWYQAKKQEFLTLLKSIGECIPVVNGIEILMLLVEAKRQMGFENSVPIGSSMKDMDSDVQLLLLETMEQSRMYGEDFIPASLEPLGSYDEEWRIGPQPNEKEKTPFDSWRSQN